MTKHIDQCWSVDLLDFIDYGIENNKGYRYVLTCIDDFSKYAWGIPLKNKTNKVVLNAFMTILESGRKPKRFWSDKGKEFYNELFQNFLEKQGIEIHSTYSELKAVFIERFNRTLRTLLKVSIFVDRKYNWIDKLSTALHIYNNRKHRTIKMSPVEGSKQENENYIYNLFIKAHNKNYRKPKYKLGDLVRVPDKRTIFSKGDSTNWSYELFKIYKIVDNKPPEYLIEDERGFHILGIHYEQELLKSSFTFKRNREILKSMNIDF